MLENRERLPEVNQRDITVDYALYNLGLALQAIMNKFPQAFPEAFAAPAVATPEVAPQSVVAGPPIETETVPPAKVYDLEAARQARAIADQEARSIQEGNRDVAEAA